MAAIGAHRLQQLKGADNVGLDERFGATDGMIDMAFCSKVENSPRPVAGEQAIEQQAVCNVTVDEQMARVMLQSRQRFKVAGIGELIEVDDRLIMPSEPIQDEVGTDEAGTACDEDHAIPSHGRLS